MSLGVDVAGTRCSQDFVGDFAISVRHTKSPRIRAVGVQCQTLFFVSNQKQSLTLGLKTLETECPDPLPKLSSALWHPLDTLGARGAVSDCVSFSKTKNKV